MNEKKTRPDETGGDVAKMTVEMDGVLQMHVFLLPLEIAQKVEWLLEAKEMRDNEIRGMTWTSEKNDCPDESGERIAKATIEMDGTHKIHAFSLDSENARELKWLLEHIGPRVSKEMR